MKHPTQPNQLCRIVGSWSQDTNQGVGPNAGKTVTTVSLYPMLASGTTPVWKVSGKDLVSNYGAVGDTVDCLLYWLEVIEEPPVEPKQEHNSLELINALS